METLADLGEDGLLARIVPLLPAGGHTLLGPGDDAAVLAAPDGRVVVSTDVLVEDRHFRRTWPGSDVGFRAGTANLADVAAMGARPTGLVVALVLPADVAVTWVEDLARGLAEVCGPDVGVVGGDLSSGAVVTVAVTVLGDLEGRSPVLRSGARPGEVVAHAGVRGRSAAGYALAAAGVDPGEVVGGPAVVGAHRRPTCPLGAGPLAARAGASAMLDVSDGLLLDGARMARASGVVLDLDPRAFEEDLAAVRGAAEVVGVDPMDWVLGGGEDHGLLATFPRAVPAPFRPIGRVLPADPGSGDGGVVLVGGAAPRAPRGWDHFAS